MNSATIHYPFTAIPNARLEYYLTTAVSRPPVQTAILLFLERAITGWRKRIITMSVSDIARGIKATRSATSKGLKELANTGEIKRSELTGNGYTLSLPNTLDAQARVQETTPPCVRMNTPERPLTSTKTEEKALLKKKEKEKNKQIDPPNPPKGGDSAVSEKSISKNSFQDPNNAFDQLQKIYPVACTDQELALKRLTRWLDNIPLKTLLATVVRYKKAAPYHVPLECFLSPSCLPKWLGTEENMTLPEPTTQKPPKREPQQRQRKQRRPRRSRQNHVSKQEHKRPKQPSEFQEIPSKTSPETIVWCVFSASGKDIRKALITLSLRILEGHTDLEHAAAGLVKWLPSVWEQAPTNATERLAVSHAYLREAMEYVEKNPDLLKT